MKILFICSSNVCRSPYAEYKMKQLIAKSEVLSSSGIQVSSSAVFNQCNHIHEKTVMALISEGIERSEILKHKPSFVKCDPTRFEEAEIIVGMSKSHCMMTPKKYRDKFITLSELATDKYYKIPDPFMIMNQEKYNSKMSIIKEFLIIFTNDLEIKYKNK